MASVMRLIGSCIIAVATGILSAEIGHHRRLLECSQRQLAFSLHLEPQEINKDHSEQARVVDNSHPDTMPKAANGG